MIEDYSHGFCPVIEIKDFERAKLSLPTRKIVNDTTKSDTFTVFLDGDEEKFVMFDWDVKADKWRLRNRLVVDVNISPKYRCKGCWEKRALSETEHIVNKEVTKKKCKICQTVSDI